MAEELDANPTVVERVYRTMIDAFIAAELAEHAELRGPLTPQQR